MQQLKRWIQRFNNARIQGLARRNANLRLTVDTEATESDQFSESVYAYGNVTDEEYLMSVTDVTSLEASIKNILGMNTHDQVPPEIPLPIFPTDSLRSPSPIVRQGSEGRAKPQAKLAKEVVERPKPVKILKRDVEVSNAQSFATSMKSGSIAPNDDEKAEILKNILLGNVFAPSPSTVEPEKVVSPIAKRVQPQPQFTILKRQAKDVPQDSTDSKTTPAVKQAATKSLPKEKEPKPAQVRPTAILKRNATPEPQRTAAPALKSQQQTLFDILLGGSSKADSSVGYREPVLSPGPSFTESSPVSQSDSPQIMRSASHQSSQNSRPSIAAANTQPKRASLSEQQRSSALEDIMLGVSSSQSQNTMKPPKPPQRKGMKHGSSLESIDTQSSNATSKSVLLDLLVAKTPSASSQKAKLPEIQTTRTRSGRGISPAVSLMDILDTHPTSPSVVTMFQRQLKPSEPDQKAKLLSLLLNGS